MSKGRHFEGARQGSGPRGVVLAEIPYSGEAEWVERPNRFMGLVRLDSGDVAKVHVRDPGRLTELLYPGNRVLIRRAPSGTKRKTGWDLVAARFEDQWVLVNSGHHPEIARSILSDPRLCPFGRPVSLKGEVKFGQSRLDFLLEAAPSERGQPLAQVADRADKKCGKIFIEVKGCTLARDGIALFPDAPTSRGARHLEELMEAKRQGFGAAILVLVFRQDAEIFSPNGQTDPRFAELFHRAVCRGVECYPVKIAYSVETEQALYVESIPFKA